MANALEWKVLSLNTEPMISYSTSIGERWEYQTTISRFQPRAQPSHPDPPGWSSLGEGTCRAPPHHLLELWSSPGLALHSHPLSPWTCKRQRVWGFSFLSVTTHSTTLHCLYAKEAYVPFVNDPFSPPAVHLMEEKVCFCGDVVGTKSNLLSCGRGWGSLCFVSTSPSPLCCP